MTSNKQTPYIKIERLEGSDKALLVFSSVNCAAGRFMMHSSTQKIPFNRIYLNDMENRFYQCGIPGLGNTLLETIVSLKVILAELGVTEIHCIGSSMGAWGALIFGTLIGAKSCMALGPETQMHIPHSRSEIFIPKNTPIIVSDVRPLLSASEMKTVIISGELDVMDIIAALHVNELRNVDVYLLKDGEHPVTNMLATRLSPENLFLDFFISGDISGIASMRGNLVDNPEIISVIASFHSEVESGDSNAQYDISGFLKIADGYALAYFLAGQSMLRTNNYITALNYFDRCCSMSETYSLAHYRKGMCLAALGKLEEALHSYNMATQYDRRSAWAYYRKGNVLQKLGRLLEAELSYREACEIQPGNNMFITKLSMIPKTGDNAKVQKFS